MEFRTVLYILVALWVAKVASVFPVNGIQAYLLTCYWCWMFEVCVWRIHPFSKNRS